MTALACLLVAWLSVGCVPLATPASPSFPPTSSPSPSESPGPSPTPTPTATPEPTPTPGPTPEAEPGALLGTFWNTYYYVAEEANHPGPAEATLHDQDCGVITTVSTGFADALCLEGSGRLEDDRLLNYYRRCDCATACSICFSVLDPATHPWGMGSRGNALEPLLSIAADLDELPFGSWLYSPRLDGLEIPARDGLGGFTHDGCLRVDDVGGGIEGDHIDWFAGSPALWGEMEGLLPTGTRFPLYEGDARCGP